VTRQTGRILGALAAAALVLAACGGDDSSSDTTAAPQTTEGSTDTTETPDTTEPTEEPEGPTDYEPGDVAFRVVNLLDEPVDVYVRTSGLVTAYLVEEGLAPGEVTDRHAPPAEGLLVVTRAGAGDAECVSACDHFITEASTFPEEGDLRTIILYDDAGTPRGFEAWENPGPERLDSANAMVAADPDAGIVVAIAVALKDADFGQRLSFDGGTSCEESFNLENVLVGGNQTPAFAYDGNEIDVLLHDNQDRDCTSEPTGGPFTVTGGPGTRSMLILSGSPGAMAAIVLPIGDDSTDPSTPSTGGGAPADAAEILAADFVDAFGLPQEDADCVVGGLIDELGADFFFDASGELLDPGVLSDEDYARFEESFLAGVEACGIDPSLIGG
jgi:hypothetical protein